MKTTRLALAATIAASLSSPSFAAGSDFEQQIDAARTVIMADPNAALRYAAAAKHEAGAIADLNQRAVSIATAQTLEADALVRLDRIDDAMPLATAALATLSRRSAHTRIEADALIVDGIIHAIRGNLATALKDYQAAYQGYRAAGANREEARSLLHIGSLYGDATDYVSALKYIDQASELYREDPIFQIALYNNRAAALQEIGRFGEAEAGYRRALTIAQRMNSPLLTARLLGNVARARLKLGNVAGAEFSLAQADSIARQGEAASAQPQLNVIAAQAAYQRHDYAAAERLIARRFAGVDLATTTIQFREAHETAYNTYRALGDTRLALAHLAALKRLDDQATRLATSANAALASARFDFANQELKLATVQRDDANRKVELERQRVRTQQLVFLVIGGAIAIVVALLAAGVVTLRRSRDRERAAAADLAVTNGALNKALAVKTEFLATTSHEIRTPLNGILGMTQVMLADARLPGDTRERIGIVHGAGVTMRALVDDILDVAKMETGNLTVEDAPFDLAATLREAAKLWREQARAKGLAFELDLAACPATIMGDAARVRQIAFNLLSNALKFTETGSVGLSVGTDGDRYRLSVRDSGIGIDEAQRETIFESFRQADAGTTRRFGGTGLGLAICRNLARAMGGEIGVTSEPGVGSIFTVTLPLREAASPAAPSPTPVFACDTTLVVDANPISRAKLTALIGKRDARAVGVASIGDVMPRAYGACVLVDQSALVGLNDPAADLMALREGATKVVVLWKGEAPAEIGAVASRIVAKPVAGAELLDAVFDAAASEELPTPLVPRAA